MIYEMRTRPKFMRSSEGVLAGVLQGLANTFKIDVMVLRLSWLALVLFFGTGVFLYVVLALPADAITVGIAEVHLHNGPLLWISLF